MSFLGALKKINPVQLFQKSTSVLSFVISIIDGVQAISNAAGPEKKARVLDELEQRLKDAEDLVGKDFAYDPAVAEAASNFIDAAVAFKKALAASKAVKPAPVVQ